MSVKLQSESKTMSRKMLKPWHLMDCFAALNITLPVSVCASEWGQSLLALSDEVGRSGQYKRMSTDAFEQTASPVFCFGVFWAEQSSATAEGEEWLTYQPCRHIYCAHRLNVKQFVICWKNCWDSSSQAAATCIYLCQQRRRAWGELRWNIVKCSARHKQTEQCEKMTVSDEAGVFHPLDI